MSWAGHVADVGEMRGAYWVLVRKPEGKDHSEELGVRLKIILKWTFKKCDRGCMD